MTAGPLQLCDLNVTLSGRPILHDVNAVARPGDAIALIGRNGAGKSTLLRAAAGLCRLRSGTVTLDGRSLATMSAAGRAARIAFVAQRSVVSAAFNVREVVSLSRFALPRDDARVDAAIARFGLEELREREYHELSVGQQQRVALARAWAQSSKSSLLCLDEPFAAMDLGETARSLDVVRHHADNGGLVIAVLHDLSLASALATRVWLMDEGRLVADGAPSDVLAPRELERWFRVRFHEGPDGPIPQLRRPLLRDPNATLGQP